LGQIDLRNTDKLILTPRQRLAIAQELEYQQLGLKPFEDPTPWQRLSRQEQTTFNDKYNALPADVQEFARRQFTDISDERQEHAFEMFLSLDLETLIAVIRKELVREQQALKAQEEERRRQQAERQRQEEIRRQQAERQRQEEARRQFELQQQRRQLQEVPRNQNGNSFNNFQQQRFKQPQQAAPQFQQPQQATPQFQPQQRQPNNLDPRRIQLQQQGQLFQQSQQSLPQQQFNQQQFNQQQFAPQQQQQQFQTQFQQFQPQQQVQRQQSFQPQQKQFQQQQGFQQQNQFAQRQQPARQPTRADLRHFARAEAQIQEAVRLQACLANPTGPGC